MPYALRYIVTSLHKATGGISSLIFNLVEESLFSAGKPEYTWASTPWIKSKIMMKMLRQTKKSGLRNLIRSFLRLGALFSMR
jgi:hypothetical protein